MEKELLDESNRSLLKEVARAYSRERLDKALRASQIPPMMHEGIIQYITNGYAAGSFLMAIFKNDLRDAAARADENSRRVIWDYVNFLHNNAPGMCWGSPENVNIWLERHRQLRKQQEA